METNPITHCFDLRVCRLAAIKKAAYKFGHLAVIDIRLKGEYEANVSIELTDKATSPELIRTEFCAEVLDQELREVVAEETAPVRNLLLAQAFSPISLIEPEAEHQVP